MAKAASTFPNLETQKNEIAEKSKKPLKSGDVWYLIDNKWFKQWEKFVGYDNWDTPNVGDHTTRPGPIDNSLLFRDDGTGDIKDHLIDGLDYVLLPEEAWDLLVQWYSIVEGQQPIARNVVKCGMFEEYFKVEVYLLEYKLTQNTDPDHYITKKFSKADTIEHIENEMRKLFNIPEGKETRLWNRFSRNTYEQLSNKENTVHGSDLHQGQGLIIEQKNDDNTWPRRVKRTGSAMSFGSTTSTGAGDNRPYCNQAVIATSSSYGSVGGGYSNTSYICDYHASGQPGLCCLGNLGNTYFMNSAIQITAMASNQHEDMLCTCEACELSFTSIKTFEQHLKRKKHRKQVKDEKRLMQVKSVDGGSCLEETKAKDYACDICETQFTVIIPNTRHLKSKHHAKIIRRKKAEDELSSLEDSGSDSDLPEPYRSCYLCKKRFRGPESYAEHMRSKSHEKRKCELRLLRKIKAMLGISEVSDAEDLCEDIKGEKVSAAAEELRCKVCDEVFTGSVSFAQHILSKAHKKRELQNKLLGKLSEI